MCGFRRDRQKRKRRKEDWTSFIGSARDRFAELARNDPRQEFFRSIYGFHTVQGAGSGDPTIFEVFYGARPYDKKVEFTDENGKPLDHPQKRLLSETGAHLIYSQRANGAVLCTLEPARAEGYGRRESSMLLELIRNPGKLLKDRVIRCHWNHFIAYAEVSSLDGDPTPSERLRVWYLMKTRHLLVKGQLEKPRYWTWLEYAAWFILAVGLNGFVIAIIQTWLSARGAGGLGAGLGPG